MGHFRSYTCTTCHKAVWLGGPEEFRFNWRKKRVEVDHHDRKHNRDGLWVVLWCPTCRKKHRAVVAEFVEPVDALALWGNRGVVKPEFRRHDPERFRCSCGTMGKDVLDEHDRCNCRGTFHDDGFLTT